ncbi:MAG TPA: nucleoside deaminase [Terriglobia bacterium]|nr:nucleoside deaminase [Terriglobia bacterium]
MSRSKAGGGAAESWMFQAIQLALENVRAGAGGPFAALVVRDGRAVAKGTNRVTSTNDPTAHAEIVAIREACRSLGHFQLLECEIYSTCEPCPMCLGAIYWARPSKVYYAATRQDAAQAGFDDSFIYDQLQAPLDRRSIPMLQLLREEAKEALRAWESKSDKVKY